MAIIGKIREKSWVLVAFVGLALVAFILGDYLKGGPANPGGGIGTVDGEPVNPQLYQYYQSLQERNDATQAQQQGREYTDRDRQNSADRAWQQTTERLMLDKEFEALGIEVKESEMYDQIAGKNGFVVNPEIEKQFIDSTTGKYNPDLLLDVLKQKDNDTSVQRKQEWMLEKSQRIEYRRTEKYYQLMQLGAYTTQLEAKEEYLAQKTTKSISYVMNAFSRLTDEEMKITDTEVRAFYEEHKTEKKYEAKGGRDVHYFDIQILPSKADSSAFNTTLAKTKMDFAASIDDSAFVMTNSQVKNYNSKANFYRVEGTEGADPAMTYPRYMDTVFKTAAKGQIVGPYNNGESVCIAKMLGFNTKEARVRHILISAERKNPVAVAKAAKQSDSILSILNKGNFDALCKQFSGDPGSKDKGGVIEWFMDNGQMVPEFAKYSMNEPVGKFGKTQTDFGFHIIEVLDRKMTAPSLAVVQTKLVASPTTLTEVAQEANDVLYMLNARLNKYTDGYKKAAMFDTIAKQKKYFSRPIRIEDQSPKAQGFSTIMAEDKILNLAYDMNAEIGQLCDAPIKDEKRYIIAIISSIREVGVPAYEDVYETMKGGAIKAKKAKRFVAQMTAGVKSKSFDALAKVSKSMVSKADVVFANPQIQGAGYEPELVGFLFGNLKAGMMTSPIVGESGVYVVRVDNVTAAPKTATYEAEQKQLTGQVKGNTQSGINNALTKLNDVKDTRKIR